MLQEKRFAAPIVDHGARAPQLQLTTPSALKYISKVDIEVRPEEHRFRNIVSRSLRYVKKSKRLAFTSYGSDTLKTFSSIRSCYKRVNKDIKIAVISLEDSKFNLFSNMKSLKTLVLYEL